MQQLLRHPLTGELPVGFRNPRPHRGEVGPQPFYRIAGGAPTEEELEEARKKAEAEDESGKTFTQAELTAKLTDEKRQGERAAARKIMETLGFATMAEAEKFINDKREADTAALSEADKKLAEATEKERKADERERIAAARERKADIRSALVELGASGEDLTDAYDMLSPKLTDDDLEEEAIVTAAEALKERRPELFAGEVINPPKKKGGLPAGKPGQRKTPPGTPRGAGGRAAAKARGFKVEDED